MKYINNPKTIYNLIAYFKKNIVPDLGNDNRVWAESFKLWLLKQGANIEVCPAAGRWFDKSLLGIAPNFDKLAFEDECKLIMFSLRWS